MKCGTLIWRGFGEISKCGKPAVKYFDRGKSGGHPVCKECAKACHPLRLSAAQHRVEPNADHAHKIGATLKPSTRKSGASRKTRVGSR